MGSKWAFCAGHPVAHHSRRAPPFWVHDYANNWLLMSSYHLTEANLLHYISRLQKFKPDLLGGYPSSIYLLALANRHLGCKVRPRAIYTSSETLFDHYRKVIEESFGCRVFTYYGNAERAAFIAECEHGRCHLRPEHSYVEFLDSDDKPAANGSEGRMICTAFGNYAMPLVRYDIGDIAVLSENQTCECGRSGPLIDRIAGRTEDYIVTPDGRFVAGLGNLFKDAIKVRMAQVVQDNSNEITIRIVREVDYAAEDEQRILDEARRRLGRKIGIRFDYVADIPRTKNGKFRFIVSNVHAKKLFSKAISFGNEI
ncbi:MAG: phenylacetate--CoA ligase family protein [Planctomycetota bacterium]